MARPLLVLFMIVVLVSAAMAVNAQSTKTQGRPSEAGRPSSTDATNESQPEAGKTSRRPGQMTVVDNGVDGRYVEFGFDLDACRVTGFAVYSTVFFDTIQLPGTGCRIGKGDGPGAMSIDGEAGSLRLHDSPNGLVQFQGENASVAFTVAQGVNVTAVDDWYELSSGNLSARAFGEPGRRPGTNGTNVTWNMPELAGSSLTILFHPASGTSPERREILDAIKEGKIGAETDVLFDNGSFVSQTLTFDNVTLHMAQRGADRFDFTVASNLSEGRVFVTNFAPGAWDPGRLRVDYGDVDDRGGVSAAMIRPAGSLEELLSTRPGGEARYFAFEDAEGWHAVVLVPEFSVHVFQVVGLPLQVVPLLLYGVVIVGLFFAAGGVGIFLERRARS